jgi:HEPN domain-containing protein
LEAQQALEAPLSGVLAAPDVPVPPRVKARLSRLLRDARIALTGAALRFGVTPERYDELARAALRLEEALRAIDGQEHETVVAHASKAARKFAQALQLAARHRRQRHHREEPRLPKARSG